MQFMLRNLYKKVTLNQLDDFKAKIRMVNK